MGPLPGQPPRRSLGCDERRRHEGLVRAGPQPRLNGPVCCSAGWVSAVAESQGPSPGAEPRPGGGHVADPDPRGVDDAGDPTEVAGGRPLPRNDANRTCADPGCEPGCPRTTRTHGAGSTSRSTATRSPCTPPIPHPTPPSPWNGGHVAAVQSRPWRRPRRGAGGAAPSSRPARARSGAAAAPGPAPVRCLAGPRPGAAIPPAGARPAAGTRARPGAISGAAAGARPPTAHLMPEDRPEYAEELRCPICGVGQLRTSCTTGHADAGGRRS